MKKHIETLSDWIESREVRGYYTFTKEDIEKQFPSAGKVYIKTALYRLAAKAKIVSPWRNFYVIMPVEYSLKGVIPPVFYMDQLMSYLGKRYYVALLNAASFYGASHQRVQTFSLMVEQPSMRNTSKRMIPFSRHRPYRSFNVWVIFWNMYWKERIWRKPYIPKWRLQD